jgi:hypothetical protein
MTANSSRTLVCLCHVFSEFQMQSSLLVFPDFLFALFPLKCFVPALYSPLILLPCQSKDYVPKMNRGGASSVQEEMVNASQPASSLVGGHKPKVIWVEVTTVSTL